MPKERELSWLDSRNQNQQTRRIFEQERLTVRVTELIMSALEQRGLTKADLARELGKSRAFVTKVLSGQRNMTLHTLADLASTLGCRAQFRLVDLAGPELHSLELPESNISAG